MKITSRTRGKSQTKIDERYVGHANTLIKDGLAPKVIPSLKEIWKNLDASEWIMTQSGKIEVEEDVTNTSVLYFI